MKNNTVFIPFLGVACMAALLLTASHSYAEKPTADDAHTMDHHHDGHAAHAGHAGHAPLPKNVAVFVKKADALCAAGQYEESLPVYTKAVKANPNIAEVYFKRGRAFFHIGGDLSAIEDFSKAIELDPNHWEAYFRRAVVWRHTGEEEKMIEDLKAAAKVEEVDHTTHEHVLK